VTHGEIDRRVSAGLARNVSGPLLCLAWVLRYPALAVSTAARWCLSLLRPDVFFTPYFPAVFLPPRSAVPDRDCDGYPGRVSGVVLNFGDAPTDFGQGRAVGHLYDRVRPQRFGASSTIDRSRQSSEKIAKRLIREEAYRKAHRRRTSTPAEKQIIGPFTPCFTDPAGSTANLGRYRPADAGTVGDLTIDRKLDGHGCDIKDLLLSELGPYGQSASPSTVIGCFLPANWRLSLALIFHELATNAGKYGAFSARAGYCRCRGP